MTTTRNCAAVLLAAGILGGTGASAGTSALAPTQTSPRAPNVDTEPSLAERMASLSWAEEDGHPVRLSTWQGQPRIVTLFYTQCRIRCPMTMNKLKAIQAAFQTHGQQAQFFLVSLDPTGDTPSRLKRYRAENRLPHENWHLLKGSTESMAALARVLDVRPIRDDDHILHDTKIALLSPDGRRWSEWRGWDFAEQEMLRASAGQ